MRDDVNGQKTPCLTAEHNIPNNCSLLRARRSVINTRGKQRHDTRETHNQIRTFPALTVTIALGLGTR